MKCRCCGKESRVPEKGLSLLQRDEWSGASAYLSKVLFGPWQKGVHD